MNNNMNNNNNEIIKMVDRMDKEERIKFIYKWHNGLALAEDLKVIIKDETFEFIPFITDIDSSEYIFKNKNNDCIIIDKHGNIKKTNIQINPIFVRISQQRLAKTSSMFKMFELKDKVFA